MNRKLTGQRPLIRLPKGRADKIQAGSGSNLGIGRRWLNGSDVLQLRVVNIRLCIKLLNGIQQDRVSGPHTIDLLEIQALRSCDRKTGLPACRSAG